MNRVGYFLRRPALLLSLLFILLVVMSALFAPWLTPFDEGGAGRVDGRMSHILLLK